MPKVIRYRNGREIEVDAQIIMWRKKQRKFRKYRRLILNQLLAWYSNDVERAVAFLNTPHPELGNAPPKQFMNLRQIKRLWHWLKKGLK